MEGDVAKADLINEISVLSRLRHPNVRSGSSSPNTAAPCRAASVPRTGPRAQARARPVRLHRCARAPPPPPANSLALSPLLPAPCSRSRTPLSAGAPAPCVPPRASLALCLIARARRAGRRAGRAQLVMFLGACTIGAPLIILNEYMSGGNLEDYLLERSPLYI